MEITLDKVKSRTDPYQLFLDSIRNPATLKRYQNLAKDKSEDIQQFDKLWKTLLDEVSKDANLMKLRTMGLQIHVENLRLRQQLVERINLRHKL